RQTASNHAVRPTTPRRRYPAASAGYRRHRVVTLVRSCRTASRFWPRARILLITAAVADGALRVAALIDIQRQPASQIRGRKGMWAAAVALVSSAGVVPVSYFVLRQRRE